MFYINYFDLLLLITLIWVFVRVFSIIKNKKIDFIYEIKLLTIYICIVVIVRIVYFAWHLDNGRIKPLIFDIKKIFPLWINFIPFIHMFEIYDGWLVNLIGNISMFIPVGFLLPFCFLKLNSVKNVVFVGFKISLFIELSQLILYERSTDIDDLILNTLGVFIGALIYFSIFKRKENTK